MSQDIVVLSFDCSGLSSDSVRAVEVHLKRECAAVIRKMRREEQFKSAPDYSKIEET